MSRALGVLGMSPAASLAFLDAVQAFTPAKADGEQIRVIADINPNVPDRNTLGSLAGPTLAEMGGALRGAGAEALAIVSNSAHAWASLIQRASGLPLIDMIETGASAARASGARRVGVLGARASLRLYREYLAAQAMGVVALPPERQPAFADLIASIRAGHRDEAVREGLAALAEDLAGQGAEVIIAGSVEAMLVLRPEDVRRELIDPGELLARRCAAVCLGLEPAPALPES